MILANISSHNCDCHTIRRLQIHYLLKRSCLSIRVSSQNHRMGRVWKEPQWVTWSNLSVQTGSSQSKWTRIVSRWFWNTFSNGDSTLSLDNLFQCSVTAQGRSSSSCPGGTSVHPFLPGASCPITGHH